MSNNSYPTLDGGEIGRSQAEQAFACGIEPHSDMNPVLLKPTGDARSQVVVEGRVWQTLAARDYYQHTPYLMERALAAYDRLAARHDAIVAEGAGSVAEVNLFARDITNLRFAVERQIPAVLVADIERGGVFASLIGSVELLPPEQRALVRTFAVNRFRGDRTLFDEGVQFLEQRLGIPCLGVFPYAPDIHLPAEDALDLPQRADGSGDVAALQFPRISNFTDLSLIPGLDWLTSPPARQYRVVFLPGTKNTIGDLAWLRERGFEPWLRAQAEGGATIVGICGGYQMLGRQIFDPHRLETDEGAAEGLGYLPVETEMAPEKITRPVRATLANGERFAAYEIHMGRTPRPAAAEPFALLEGEPEGVRMGNIVGTYLHGAFESPAVAAQFGITLRPDGAQQRYDQMADWLEEHSRPQVLEALVG